MNFFKFFNFVFLFSSIIINAGSTKKSEPKRDPKFNPNLHRLLHFQKKLPIVFHPDYDISFYGLEKLHPFDTKKYGKVFNFLKEKYGINENQIYKPEMVSVNDLLLVHTKEYLDKLNDSKYVAQIAEIGALAYVPNFVIQRNLLNSMKLATQGTIIAAEKALERQESGELKFGWGINLSGGYHHAKSNSGEGFCFFADIPLVAQKLWQQNRYKNLKILVVDLDAHQGNGHESIFKNNPKVATFDVYNRQIYPNDREARKYIKYDFPVTCQTNDKQYIEIVQNELKKAIENEKPELIIYNAGTDIFEEDPLGRMKISKKGIIERDFIVFNLAIERKIPILMVLSGGYSEKSANIICKSLENIIEKILKKNNLF